MQAEPIARESVVLSVQAGEGNCRVCGARPMGLFPSENSGTYMDGSFFRRNLRRAYHCISALSLGC